MLGGWRGVNALIGHHTGLHDFQGGMPSDAVLVIAVTQPAAMSWKVVDVRQVDTPWNQKIPVAKFIGIEITWFIKLSKS